MLQDININKYNHQLESQRVLNVSKILTKQKNPEPTERKTGLATRKISQI